jgi:hypothetical protein
MVGSGMNDELESISKEGVKEKGKAIPVTGRGGR